MLVGSKERFDIYERNDCKDKVLLLYVGFASFRSSPQISVEQSGVCNTTFLHEKNPMQSLLIKVTLTFDNINGMAWNFKGPFKNMSKERV